MEAEDYIACCLDCGGRLDRRGAPGICAAGHDPHVPTHADLAEITAGMTTERWIKDIPAQAVAISDVTPIQEEPTLLFPGRAHQDPIIHLVRFDHRLYVEDGHHRFFAARRAGHNWILARVISE